MFKQLIFLIFLLGCSLVGATEIVPVEAADIFPLQWQHVTLLLLIGLVGGLVSGFIGSSGAFIFTPAMMILGIPAIIAVASTMCHKFPKSIISALKRIRNGLVDIKLAIVIGISAEIGILCGAALHIYIKNTFGYAGSNIYVAIIFLLVLVVLGFYNLRDSIKTFKTGESNNTFNKSALAQKVHSTVIPGTMMYFPSLGTKISVLFTIPIGFITGLVAANIAVGSFISVPAMIYVLGAGGLMASATQLLVAFVVGFGGTIQYAMSGFVDIRIAMVILAGSLLGMHLGAIAATYAKDYLTKIVTGVLMVLLLFSLAAKIIVYMHDSGAISLVTETIATLNYASFNLLLLALVAGTSIILYALISGNIKHNRVRRFMEEQEALSPDDEEEEEMPTSISQLSPTGRFERILLVTDKSEATVGATREAIRLAQRTDGKLIAMSVLMTNSEHASLARQLIEKENDDTLAHLEQVRAEATKAGVTCDISVRHGIEIYQEIIDEAEQNYIDVIVMGCRGMTGFTRLMKGSNTAKVIGYAQCSILIVPKTAMIQGKKILLAVDGSRYSDIAACTAMSIAKHIHASVLVVSVVFSNLKEQRYTKAVQEIKRVESFLSKEGIEVEGEVLSGKPADVLVEIADAKGVDLIVMGSHGRTGLDRVMLGSVSDRVISYAHCAVLVVKL
ncbi:TSUP family transporter [Candidatus Halobeggiatoa sp. HSG11]|nr:TSUP family transporter [Candidatus Halobeggiatoa sp. HSG11]